MLAIIYIGNQCTPVHTCAQYITPFVYASRPVNSTKLCELLVYKNDYYYESRIFLRTAAPGHVPARTGAPGQTPPPGLPHCTCNTHMFKDVSL